MKKATMYNEPLLRSMMVLRGKTTSALAKTIDVSKSTMAKRMRSGNYSRDEIERIITDLNLTSDEAFAIFFPHKVPKKKQNDS